MLQLLSNGECVNLLFLARACGIVPPVLFTATPSNDDDDDQHECNRASNYTPEGCFRQLAKHVCGFPILISVGCEFL